MIGLLLSVLSALMLAILIQRACREEFERFPSWRVFALAVVLVNALLVVVVTEALSGLGRLELAGVLVAWVLLVSVQIPGWWRIARTIRGARSPSGTLSRPEIGLLVLLGAVILCAGLLGSMSAPNTWDSLTYHLSRVAHWKQNGSVAFFPTPNERQLFFPPFAEYAILHLQILTASDRFAAMVQWLSFCGSLVAVSLLAAELGVNRRGQLYSIVFAATIPIAILQASSTQNDLVVTFWLLCFCLFSLKFVKHRSLFSLAASAGALGLGLLTKPTAYLLIPGFAIGYLIMTLRTHGVRRLPVVFGGLLLAAGIPAAFYSRNMAVYDAPVGSSVSRLEHSSPSRDVGTLLSNLIRGAAVHASAPPDRLRLPERVKSAVEHLERMVRGAEPSMALDAANWRYTTSREDRAGAPNHLLIVLVVLGAVLTVGRTWRLREPAYWHVVGLVVGAGILTSYLQWNVWIVRFHMNLLILAAPLVGLVMGRLKNGAIAVGLCVVLFTASIYPMLWNQLHPLMGPNNIFRTERSIQYFAAWDARSRDQVLALIDSVRTREDSVIGMHLGRGSLEYPYWVLLPRVNAGLARLCHVGVSNPSSNLQSEDCKPSVIISDHADSVALLHRDVRYVRRWTEGRFGMYLPGE